jgi:hypothetical protein
MFKFLTLFGILSLVSSININNDMYKNENYSSVISFAYKSCGTSTDLAQNLKMNIDPQLPQTDYTFYLDYDLSKDIKGGISQYDVNFNGIPMSPTKEVLCDEIAKSNITCPINAGHVESQSKGTVPTGISGKAVIKNQWFNENNERVLCIEYTMKLS